MNPYSLWSLILLASGFALSIALPLEDGAPLEHRDLEGRGVLPDWYNRLNSVEKQYCIKPNNWAACYYGYKHSVEAEATAKSLFSAKSLTNGKGDAFRHCYWNARMTIDSWIGFQKAKEIATNHEASSGNNKEEKNMDLTNNDRGRKVGLSLKKNAGPKVKEENIYKQAQSRCKEMASNGKKELVIIDPNS